MTDATPVIGSGFRFRSDSIRLKQQNVVIPTGIEPVTYRLGICRSILLSYGTTRPDT